MWKFVFISILQSMSLIKLYDSSDEENNDEKSIDGGLSAHEGDQKEDNGSDTDEQESYTDEQEEDNNSDEEEVRSFNLFISAFLFFFVARR